MLQQLLHLVEVRSLAQHERQQQAGVDVIVRAPGVELAIMREVQHRAHEAVLVDAVREQRRGEHGDVHAHDGVIRGLPFVTGERQRHRMAARDDRDPVCIDGAVLIVGPSQKMPAVGRRTRETTARAHDRSFPDCRLSEIHARRSVHLTVSVRSSARVFRACRAGNVRWKRRQLRRGMSIRVT